MIAQAALSVASTRQDRRKLRTRARLIAAAHHVFSRKGVDTATINDITEAADVGFGTFYNYFDSKDAILAAASAEAIEAHGSALDKLTAAIDDAAEVMAVSIRHTVRMVDHDPMWAWFAVHATLFHEQMEAGLGRRVLRDIRRGMKRGRFPAGGASLLCYAIGGAVWATLRGKLTGTLGADADEELAAGILRMLGIPAAEARKIAARPLPPVTVRPHITHEVHA
ncbi:MAG: TetR/AcrR family transcriptional regulator [Deltaproteobacteria bacterium]|nr:TetR/AcrR family transcriptional regulator [Deltaproteobacteria bacterium]MBI3387754.1 TetR/AcrR family transcriptional regulator [Deltaproteobacteria bacterium]